MFRGLRKIVVGSAVAAAVLLAIGHCVASFRGTFRPGYREADNLTQLQASRSPDSPLDIDNDDINWIVHVSDLHFSKFRDSRRPIDFEAFCDYLKANVDPSAVVITGDLTDSKGADRFSSRLYKEEWITYDRVIRGKACSDLNIFDIKGNHDAFDLDVEDDKSERLFQTYSSRGRQHSRSYLEAVDMGSKRLGLVAIDATPVPGLKRPFNFLGSLAEKELGKIKQLLETSETLHSDYTLFFGHYPTGTVLTAEGSSTLRRMLSGKVYLCGHLHNFIALANRMYTMHPDTDLLELELADWKDNRRYRVIAFDQGFLSFADVRFDAGSDSNVVVLVTAPKDPLFLVKSESTEKLRRIRQIRVLVFSDKDVVKVTLDGSEKAFQRTALPSKNLTAAESPLFTAPFEPNGEQLIGLHDIRLTVHFDDGATHEHVHRYSLDGTQPEFDFFPSALLLIDWLSATEFLFAASCISVVGFLAAFRILHEVRLNSEVRRIRDKSSTWSCLARFLIGQLRRFWMLAAVDKICYPVIAYVVCTSMFPLCLGRVMSHRLALIFVWGIIFVDDLSYVPPDLTFFYGVISVAFVVGPLLLILANAVESSYERLNPRAVLDGKNSRTRPESSKRSQTLQQWMWFPYRHIGMIILTVYQTLLTTELFYAYGFVATLSPIGIGRIAFSLWLYISAMYLSKEDFREICQIWPYN